MSQEFEEIRIPVPWGHIAGKWWGSKNIQPILALHGWLDNAGSFDELAPLLVKEGLSILCIDFPGHGFSSHYPPGVQYTISSNVPLLRRIITYYKWTNVSFLGHSLGGTAAFLYASTYPKEVKRYVMLDIAGPIIKPHLENIDTFGLNIDKVRQAETSETKLDYGYDMLLDIFIEYYRGSVTRKSAEILFKRGIKPSERAGNYTLRVDERLKFSVFPEFTLELVYDYAARITCETMYIRAKPGYPFKEPYYQGILEKLVNAKRKELRSLQGTHHFFLNNPHPTFNCIKDFLK